MEVLTDVTIIHLLGVRVFVGHDFGCMSPLPSSTGLLYQGNYKIRDNRSLRRHLLTVILVRRSTFCNLNASLLKAKRSFFVGYKFFYVLKLSPRQLYMWIDSMILECHIKKTVIYVLNCTLLSNIVVSACTSC